MNRRELVLRAAALRIAASLPLTITGSAAATADAVPGTSLPELSLADIAEGLKEGRLSSRQLTQDYLDRIAALDRHGPKLRAVLEINPLALQIAAALDVERASHGPRGPLHGVPVLIKDNIETADHMMTTAGSQALDGWYAPADAAAVARLRAAGAVILGKTNMSEWANFRSRHAVSGWSGRGGQTRNPYALHRSPSGSSSGSAVAVAANLCAAAIGTETDGSIVSPASVNGVVGFKPTVGLISRNGIIPIAHSQDTAGTLTRSVRDAALLLSVMAGPDPTDPASAGAAGHFENDYVRHLDPDGLRGARLGIARRFFADNAALSRFLDTQIALLRHAGAEIVDPADLPLPGAIGAAEELVLLYEFKHDLNAYLARLPANFPVRSLTELIRYNDAHASAEMPLFDQELLREANAAGSLGDGAYRKARAACLTATRSKGIDAVMARHRLDALVTLTAGPAALIDTFNGDYETGGCSQPAAVAGYPHISVPAGLYRDVLPVGVSFFGAAFSEARLLRLAAGFEHVAHGRVPPASLGERLGWGERGDQPGTP